ncbi:DUF6420 family protein [Streptomyces sp. NBC_00670]|uniref:DUF6420 family protein n=1 Tax=Streptomyces sp. NBC_00670 TaxID=2975804 RepID=UPI003FA6FC60
MRPLRTTVAPVAADRYVTPGGGPLTLRPSEKPAQSGGKQRPSPRRSSAELSNRHTHVTHDRPGRQLPGGVIRSVS